MLEADPCLFRLKSRPTYIYVCVSPPESGAISYIYGHVEEEQSCLKEEQKKLLRNVTSGMYFPSSCKWHFIMQIM